MKSLELTTNYYILKTTTVTKNCYTVTKNCYTVTNKQEISNCNKHYLLMFFNPLHQTQFTLFQSHKICSQQNKSLKPNTRQKLKTLPNVLQQLKSEEFFIPSANFNATFKTSANLYSSDRNLFGNGTSFILEIGELI